MKKLILIIFALLILCCLCSVIGFGLFGQLNLNNTCTFKGPFAHISDGPCAAKIMPITIDAFDNTVNNKIDTTPKKDVTTNPPAPIITSTTKTYSNTMYTFDYPKDWIIEEGDNSVYLYEKDAAITSSDEFINNIIISSEDIKESVLEDYTCEEYAKEYVVPAVQEIYEPILRDYQELTLNGNRTCLANLDGATVDGKNIGQIHYGVFNNGTLYYITISIDQSTKDVQGFVDTVKSFKVK